MVCQRRHAAEAEAATRCRCCTPASALGVAPDDGAADRRLRQRRRRRRARAGCPVFCVPYGYNEGARCARPGLRCYSVRARRGGIRAAPPRRKTPDQAL
ncbi:MAG: hypothetical protein MZW92_80695 [Comamonadaceae bacterium]|nr:hypothetical protein [Comamonadaceae bacterium]